MLDETLKQEIKIALNELKENINGFNLRFSQNKMIAEVAKILSKTYTQNILCVEAPTGTGKTFAYLIAGVIIAKKLEQKLIISSSNVALQEQLELKDIPDIKKYTSIEFSFVLVKGRSRYLCLRNLIQLVEAKENKSSLFDNIISFSSPPDIDDIDNLQKLLDNFELNKWNGEIDSLDIKLPTDLWNKINCNRWTCSASRCDFYDDCVFFKARKKIHSADVIIANHDLVLADIVSGNSILPDLSDSFLIFDEAHHLPKKALSHFTYNCNLENIINTNRNAVATIKKIIQLTKSSENNDYKNIQNYVKDIQNYIDNLEFDDDIFIFNQGVINQDFLVLAQGLLQNFIKLANDFDDIKNNFIEHIKHNIIEKTLKESLENAIGECEMHITNIQTALENFVLIDDKNKAPYSRWIEKSYQGKNNFHLNSAKIDISNNLNKMLWSRIKASVLTSATLSSLDSFDRFNTQISLSDENTKYLRLPSPFDYKKVNFIVAKMQFDPTRVNDHTKEVASQILSRIQENKGILVLFASNSQMQDVADLVEEDIKNLLVQGQYPKNKILEKHIENCNQGKQSVIFGLDSFAEGVDLKGDYLTLLMIAKLRFAMPNSPVEKTTNEYLQNQGKNPFIEVSMPDVSLRLIQACGRLIRTETDTGTIVIFDKRLVTKRYGKDLIKSLPKYNFIFE